MDGWFAITARNSEQLIGVDTLTKQERSARMARIKGKDTVPELVVRQVVDGLGYRYRLHCVDVLGRPDLVFRKLRKLIFVQGCFWHRHRVQSCKLARLPKSRLSFWESKLEANARRDRRIQATLRAAGWSVKNVWECRIRDREKLRRELAQFLEG